MRDRVHQRDYTEDREYSEGQHREYIRETTLRTESTVRDRVHQRDYTEDREYSEGQSTSERLH